MENDYEERVEEMSHKILKEKCGVCNTGILTETIIYYRPDRNNERRKTKTRNCTHCNLIEVLGEENA